MKKHKIILSINNNLLTSKPIKVEKITKFYDVPVMNFRLDDDKTLAPLLPKASLLRFIYSGKFMSVSDTLDGSLKEHKDYYHIYELWGIK